MTPCPLCQGFSSQKKGLHPPKFPLICATRRAAGKRMVVAFASGKVKAMKSEAEAIRDKLIALEDYRKLLNGNVLTSNWLTVDQSMIDTFADATRDHQFIHVDPVRAKAETPFGGTIAHGFLTLSLLSTLAFDVMPGVEGTRMGVNYGFDKVRFMSPVKSGARVRGKFRLVGLVERAVSVQSAWESAIEVEGAIKPALEAHWITVAMVEPRGG
jgi:acyl dehydratase